MQAVQRLLFGWWPLSSSLVGLLFVLALVGYWMLRGVRRGREGGWRAAGRTAVRMLRAAVVLLTLFFFCWGLNYGRPGVPERLGLIQAPRELMSTEALAAEYARTATVVNDLRTSAVRTEQASRPLSAEESARLGADLRDVLAQLSVGTVPVRRLRVLPKGALLRFGTAGVYSPWTGDPHIDGGLHPLQQRFTAAHELAHQQGITDEGDCNLLAYLTCATSTRPLEVYSAELTYLRYLRSAIARRDRDVLEGLSPKLDTAVVADLRAIRAASDAYTEIAPRVRDLVYDGYLRTQGVHDGLSSYGRIIDYVVAVRKARPELLGGSR